MSPVLVAIREFVAGATHAMADSGTCQRGVCGPGPGQNLNGCDFSDQDLRGVDFHDSDLSWASFAKADLRGADLSGANLSNACFTETDLRGAKLDYAITIDTVFCYTRWSDTLTMNSSCGLASVCCPLINPMGGEGGMTPEESQAYNDYVATQIANQQEP